jgi:integrase
MTRAVTMSEAIIEYRNHLRAKDLEPNTVKNALQVVTAGENCWGNIQVSSIKSVHVDRLFAAHEWAPNTRNLYLGNLRKFVAWARHHNYIAKDYDPTFGWRNVKVPNQSKIRLPAEEFYPLMDSAKHPRDRIALALGLFLFVRGSECVRIRIGDVDLKAMTIDIYRVKTKDYDTLPVCEELRIELVRWLNWYREDQGTPVRA